MEQVMATQKKMERQKEAADKLVSEWLGRAQLALSKGDEELAREALARKQTAAEQAESLEGQLVTQTASLNTLFDSMTQLEAKVAEAKAMKETYIARARTAATATKVSDMLSGIGDTGAMASFDRMKEKVEMLETKAEVAQNMLGAAKDTSLESKFAVLEGGTGTSVDAELEQMKASLLPPASPVKQLPPGSEEVEDELAKLKRELEGK